MNLLSLQSMPLDTSGFGSSAGGNVAGMFAGVAIGIIFLFILVFLAIHVYLSLAYSRIGRKAGLGNPGVAWMPGYGPLVVIFETAKAHWWPFLVLTVGLAISYPLLYIGLMSRALGMLGWGSSSGVLMTVLGGILIFLVVIVFSIMTIIWHWKTYEAVGIPGWWILIPILGVVIGYALILLGLIAGAAFSIIGVILMIIGTVVHLVLIGIAAWGGRESSNTPQVQITSKKAR